MLRPWKCCVGRVLLLTSPCLCSPGAFISANTVGERWNRSERTWQVSNTRLPLALHTIRTIFCSRVRNTSIQILTEITSMQAPQIILHACACAHAHTILQQGPQNTHWQLHNRSHTYTHTHTHSIDGRSRANKEHKISMCNVSEEKVER